MISSAIKQRTKSINNELNYKWSIKFMEFIDKYPDKLWNWYGISSNPNITMEFIDKYPDKPWDWEWISMNPNITMEIIDNNPDKPLDWNYISCNPNITMEFIDKYPNKPWNWNFISYNPNITMEFINKYPNKPWNWGYISYNKFIKNKNEFILREYKKHLASFKIQQWYHNIRMNPEYKFCRKRVNDFYDKVIQMEI